MALTTVRLGAVNAVVHPCTQIILYPTSAVYDNPCRKGEQAGIAVVVTLPEQLSYAAVANLPCHM
jgi:hypothetical protein